jgi:hypothetical protein
MSPGITARFEASITWLPECVLAEWGSVLFIRFPSGILNGPPESWRYCEDAIDRYCKGERLERFSWLGGRESHKSLFVCLPLFATRC